MLKNWLKNDWLQSCLTAGCEQGLGRRGSAWALPSRTLTPSKSEVTAGVTGLEGAVNSQASFLLELKATISASSCDYHVWGCWWKQPGFVRESHLWSVWIFLSIQSHGKKEAFVLLDDRKRLCCKSDSANLPLLDAWAQLMLLAQKMWK